MKYLLYFLAYTSFGLGLLGAFLPIVPTVPFFLLGVYLLAKVSKKNVVRIKKIPFIGKHIYQTLKKYTAKRRSQAIKATK